MKDQKLNPVAVFGLAAMTILTVAANNAPAAQPLTMESLTEQAQTPSTLQSDNAWIKEKCAQVNSGLIKKLDNLGINGFKAAIQKHSNGEEICTINRGHGPEDVDGNYEYVFTISSSLRQNWALHAKGVEKAILRAMLTPERAKLQAFPRKPS